MRRRSKKRINTLLNKEIVYNIKFKKEDLKNISETKYLEEDIKYITEFKRIRNIGNLKEKFSIPEYTKLEIIKYENISIIPKTNKNDLECKFYSISSNKNSNIIENCLPLIYGASDQFQHFLMHLFPILVSIKKFLLDNPDINIFILKPNFDSFNYLIKKLNIKNNFIFYNGRNIFCYKAYCLNINPFQNYTYLPPSIIRETHYLLNIKQYDKNLLIYMGRKNEKTRKDINHSEVCDYLLEYSLKNNLKFIDFEHHNYDIEERFLLFSKAKIVIFIHGGAGYNIYFCQKNTLIIEINFCNSMKSLGLPEDVRKPYKGQTFDCLEYITNPIGFNFYGIVCENSNKYSTKISIPLENIKKILNKNEENKEKNNNEQ